MRTRCPSPLPRVINDGIGKSGNANDINEGKDAALSTLSTLLHKFSLHGSLSSILSLLKTDTTYKINWRNNGWKSIFNELSWH